MIAIVSFHLNAFVRVTFLDFTNTHCHISVYHCIENIDDVQIFKLIYRRAANVVIVIDGRDALGCATSSTSLVRFSGGLGCKCFHVKFWISSGKAYACKEATNFAGPTVGVLRRLLMFAPIHSFKDMMPGLVSTLSMKYVMSQRKNSTTASPLWNFGNIRQSFGVSLFYSRTHGAISELQFHVDVDTALAGTYFDTLQSIQTEYSEISKKDSMKKLVTFARLLAHSTSTADTILGKSLCVFASRRSLLHLFENVHNPLAVGIKTSMTGVHFVRLQSILSSCMNTEIMKHESALHDVLGIFAWNSGKNRTLDLCRQALCTIAKSIFMMISAKLAEMGVSSRVILYKKHTGFLWFVREYETHRVRAYNAIVSQRNTHTYGPIDSFGIQVSAQKCLRGEMYNRLISAQLDNLNMRFEAAMHRAFRISCELHTDTCERLTYLQRSVCNSVRALKCTADMFRLPEVDNVAHIRTCRPTMNDSEALILENFRSDVPSQTSTRFTISISRLIPIVLIMDANTSRKSAYFRCLFRNVMLILSGRFVDANHATCPAMEFMANHALQKGLFISNFFDECMNLSKIISMSKGHSLVLLDEPCRSTSINESEYVMWAVLELLLRRSTKIVLSSHLKTLKYFADMYILPKFAILAEGDEFQDVEMNALPSNYGLTHARRSKLPIQITSNAIKISSQLPADFRERDANRFKWKRHQNEILQSAQMILYYLKRINADIHLRRCELKSIFLKI